MRRIAATLAFGLALIGAATWLPGDRAARAQAADPEAVPVLVELFTSQGCSSCPPADALAARLAREPGIVLISRPVTYWDRLGWKDTLAREENTELQRAYARRGLGGYNGVYTPQSVVAGAQGAVGSNERTLRSQIAEARQERTAAIRVRAGNPRGYAVGVAGETGRPSELILVGVSRREEVAIGRGENRGERIGYTNVLRGERKVADWSGGQASHVIAPDMLNIAGADRYALILREGTAGRVRAAQWLD